MTKAQLTHAALESLEFEDGVLTWGGHKVTEIAEELGIHKSTVSRHVKNGKKEGDIHARPMGL